MKDNTSLDVHQLYKKDTPRQVVFKQITTIYQELLLPVLEPIVAILLSMIVGGVIILIAGENPFRAYIAMINGAFGSVGNVMRTLRRTAPLIISGLAAAVAFRAGMFNFGIEGSLLFGSLAAALVGMYVSGLPPIIHIALALIVGAIFGGLWALLPGITRVKYHVDEVISTLMLNYIAILLIPIISRFVFSIAEPETRYILPSAQLPIVIQDYNLSVGIIIAILLAIIFHFIFKHSIWGLEKYMTGLNPVFSRFAGVPITPVAIMAMVVSGMLGGITGAVDVLGIYHRFFVSTLGIGFDGITIALMAKLNPLGIILGSIFIGALKNGGAVMEREVAVSRSIVVVVQGLVLLFMTSRIIYKKIQN